MFKQVALQIPVTLHVCGCGLVISLVDMIKVFDIPTNLKEMYHISDIREVGDTSFISISGMESVFLRKRIEK